MADEFAPSPPEPRLRGNSAAYLRSRLERDGHVELLRAIDAGALSVYGAACEVGYVTRPTPLGTGSPNARKRRDWAIARAYRGNARADASANAQPASETGKKINGGRLTGSANAESVPLARTPIALAAAIAEWEEAQKPPAPRERERDSAPAAPPPEPERTPFPADVLPCTSCRHPQAAAALREVLNVYMAACRGEPHQTGSTLPRACCQWVLQRPDPRAMIA